MLSFCCAGDDGIVHYNFLTEEDDQLITIRSYYDNLGTRSEEVILYRTYSHYDNYLNIETSTQKPLVCDMVLSFTANIYLYRYLLEG